MSYNLKPKYGPTIIMDPRNYPVIYDDPTFWQLVTYVRPAEWVRTAAAFAGGYGLGYFAGYKYYYGSGSGKAFSTIVGTAMLCSVLEHSGARLTGYKENSRELTLHKAAHNQEL